MGKIIDITDILVLRKLDKRESDSNEYLLKSN